MEKVLLENISRIFIAENNTEYIFKKDTYTISEGLTQEKTIYYIYTDSDKKSVAFYLDGLKNVTLDFSGSTIIFEGRISPFIIKNAENITIKNLNVFYDRPFNTCGQIIEHGDDFAKVYIDHNKFPYRIENGQFIVYGDFWEKSLSTGQNFFLEIDNEIKRPAYNMKIIEPLIGNEVEWHPDPYLPQVKWTAEEIEKGVILFKGDFSFLTGNNRFAITHENRLNNIIVGIDSKNILIENITVRDGGSMGAFFQNCENIHINNMQVFARDEKEYLLSLNADATHFFNCRGKVIVENCLFENMMDDGGNVHGVYTMVDGVCGNIVNSKATFFQQKGLNLYKKGDIIRMYSPDLESCICDFTVLESEQTSLTNVRLTLDGDTSQLKDGYLISNITAFPEVLIKNCKVGNNRPRGFVMLTCKKAIIEDCHFYTSDAGVTSYADTVKWYEATGLRDLTVRNNIFDNCGYYNSDYSMYFVAEVQDNPNIKDYHKGIKILNNTFKTFTGGCVYLKCCENYTFENNKVELTKTYSKRKECIEVLIE